MADAPPGTPRSQWQPHPAAELFPLMSGSEFDELVNDIAVNGQRDAIVLTPDGLLLDGRNRSRACAEIGIPPATRIEMAEPWAFVISTNVHRRHLTEPQRAMIGAKIAERANGQRRSHREAAPAGAASQSADLPPSQEEATRLLNVSRRSIQRARVVIKHGTEELQKATEAGKVPAMTAERVALTMQPSEQDAFVAEVAAGANPRQAAPPPPRKPEAGRNVHYRRSEVVSRQAILSFVSSLQGMEMGLQGATSVDPSITADEAARYATQLTKSMTGLRNLTRILKEHTP